MANHPKRTKEKPLPEIGRLPPGCEKWIVRADAHAPNLICGDCVVLDPSDKKPIKGGLFVLERCVVRLKYIGRNTTAVPPEARKDYPPPYWEMDYGERYTANGHAIPSPKDDVINTRHLSAVLEGRIVEILRPLN